MAAVELTGPRELLRLATAGSVDDGKSTLIGRLLLDTGSLLADHLDDVSRGGALDLAAVTDGLRAEREQGITIDVAYRFFSTPRRSFILADTPGHERYTRGEEITGHRPPDELARRLFEHGGVDGVHIYGNVVTVVVARGHSGAGIKEIIESLYIYYREGVTPAIV